MVKNLGQEAGNVAAVSLYWDVDVQDSGPSSRGWIKYLIGDIYTEPKMVGLRGYSGRANRKEEILVWRPQEGESSHGWRARGSQRAGEGRMGLDELQSQAKPVHDNDFGSYPLFHHGH